jgi:hypothetical protein
MYLDISVLVKSNMDGGSTAFALAEWRGAARFQRLVNKVKATQESKQAHLLCSLSCAWFGAVCRLAVPAAATAASPVWSGGALLLQLTTRSFIHSFKNLVAFPKLGYGFLLPLDLFLNPKYSAKNQIFLHLWLWD